MEPTPVTGAAEVPGTPISGTPEQIASGLRAFAAGGFTQLGFLVWQATPAAVEAMAPVIGLLDAGWPTWAVTNARRRASEARQCTPRQSEKPLWLPGT